MKTIIHIVLLAFSLFALQACASETDMHFRTSVLYHDGYRYQNPPPPPHGPVRYQYQGGGEVMVAPGPSNMVPAPPRPAYAEPKTFVGGGALHVGSFHTESLLVITQYGNQQVKAVVDENNTPIVVKDQQGPPPSVKGLMPQEYMVPMLIHTEPPGYPPILIPVWVVSSKP